MPVHTLTHLSTKPHNRYRYLQIRQRTLHAVTPVHTYAEYVKFKSCINDRQFRRRVIKQYSPHEAYKLIDFEKFAIYWNSEVEKQDRTEADSNKRLYYKLPTQLERHHKRTIAWKSERSTIMMGSNMVALAPFRDLLAAEDGNNAVMTIPARPLPETVVPPGTSDHSYNEDGKLTYRSQRSCTHLLQISTRSTRPPLQRLPYHYQLHQRLLQTPIAPPQLISYTMGCPMPKDSMFMTAHQWRHSIHPFASSSHAMPPIQNSHTVQKGARCAVCVKALCPRRFECDGRGRREFCKCGHPKLLPGESVRGLTEGKIATLLAARTMG
ncbi:hypothetical protein F5880DRAFT_1573957 [Lentinula raphanica]|nr:hypothetical protein F5880DRAFT_1573957 [Lentinula raphanica]